MMVSKGIMTALQTGLISRDRNAVNIDEASRTCPHLLYMSIRHVQLPAVLMTYFFAFANKMHAALMTGTE